MDNVRREGQDLVYDCGSSNCGTPGVPHRIPVAAVMAALEATFREFAFHEDPRTEALDVVLQLLYQEHYDNSGKAFPTNPLPWDASLTALLDVLNEFLEAQDSEPDTTPGPKKSDKKEYLN